MNNPLKEVFFPVEDDILFTVGRRTEEGVAEGDACGIEHGKLCKALLRAGKNENYHPMPVEGYEHSFAQVVNPTWIKQERAFETTGMNGIFSGGFPNLDVMLAQHPTGWNYPYSVGEMRSARAIPGRSNLVWGYPEAAEEQGIDIAVDYFWQDMVTGQRPMGPWQWTLLKVFPSGKTRELLRADEVPSALLKDAVLISVGKGINLYNPEMYATVIVGGRGGSTRLGGMIFDGDERLKSVNGFQDILEEIDWIIESRPESAQGIQLVIADWLEKGQSVKADGVIEYNYI